MKACLQCGSYAINYHLHGRDWDSEDADLCDVCYWRKRAEAALTPPEVSDTTQHLIDLLIERDKLGRAKYGTTLDRTDLTRDQWLQHMVEELLDGAGYALAAQRPEVP